MIYELSYAEYESRTSMYFEGPAISQDDWQRLCDSFLPVAARTVLEKGEAARAKKKAINDDDAGDIWGDPDFYNFHSYLGWKNVLDELSAILERLGWQRIRPAASAVYSVGTGSIGRYMGTEAFLQAAEKLGPWAVLEISKHNNDIEEEAYIDLMSEVQEAQQG